MKNIELLGAEGRDVVNPLGVKFYNDVINEIHANGKPLSTLFFFFLFNSLTINSFLA